MVVPKALDDVSAAAEGLEVVSVSPSQMNPADPIALPDGKNKHVPISLLVTKGDIDGRLQSIRSEIIK